MKAAAARKSQTSAWTQRRMKYDRLPGATLSVSGPDKHPDRRHDQTDDAPGGEGDAQEYHQAAFPPVIATRVLLSPFNGRANLSLSGQVENRLTTNLIDANGT